MNDSRETLGPLLQWLDIPPNRDLKERLSTFHDWLVAEAAPAGGIGPDEVAKLWTRHIGDSLTLLAGFDDEVRAVVDVGSGVGLPGIPLAVARPDLGFVLLDRSERRCHLMRRAGRILNLDNIDVVRGDAGRMQLGMDTAVSRAAMGVDDLLETAQRLLPHGRMLVVAGARSSIPQPREDAELLTIPGHLLGGPSWLYRFWLSG